MSDDNWLQVVRAKVAGLLDAARMGDMSLMRDYLSTLSQLSEDLDGRFGPYIIDTEPELHSVTTRTA